MKKRGIFLKLKKAVPIFSLTATVAILASQMSAQCNPDILPPAVLCPANLTVQVGFGICSTTVVLPAATATDNCPGAITQTNDAPAGNIFDLGITNVNFTATDAAGNTATCIMQVTLNGSYSLACNDMVDIPESPSGVTVVSAADIEEGGPYCFPRLITLGVTGPPTPTISIPGAGSFLVTLWMPLPDGSWAKVWGTINILGPTDAKDFAENFAAVKVYPNPASQSVLFELPVAVSNAQLNISDALGKAVYSASFSGNTYRFEKGGLAPGVYFYSINTTADVPVSGKLLLKQ